MKIIQDNWSRRLPLRQKNVASTGTPLKHIMGNEFNINVMDRDGWSGKSLIINILLPFHICV